METVGVIAEFDPFHKGHARLFGQVRERFPGCAVAVAMSGSFTQRGGAASCSKQDRARMALDCGADLVLLLPVTFACASAERFARGGVELLRHVGVTTLAFGSECGDLNVLQRAADALDNDAYHGLLKEALERGVSFASAREKAVRTIVGKDAEALHRPNDLLAVEYLRALRGTGVRPLPIQRRGAAHNSENISGETASASAIRTLLYKGRFSDAAEKMPSPAGTLLLKLTAQGGAPADLRRCDAALLAALRQTTAEDFARLPDVSEGLEHRLYRAAQAAVSGEDFCARAKTKRYAYARIRRILLWNWLGIRQEDCPGRIPFAQVLALNETGRGLLHGRKKSLSIPLIARPTDGKKLTGEARRQFALEQRADDLWGLCLPVIRPGGWSMTAGVYRKE